MVSGSHEKSRHSERSEHSVQEKWNACLALAESRVNAQTFKTWFAPIVAVTLQDSTLLLRVPSRFFCEWVETHYGSLLNEVITEICGPEIRMSFHVAASAEEDAPVADDALQPGPLDDPPDTIIPTAIERVSDESTCYLDTRFHLESFVAGPGDKMGLRAAQRVADAPGKDGFSPLIFFGNSGSGKSHLLHGIGNRLRASNPDARIVCLSSERFLHDYVYALQGGRIQKFIQNMTRADVFLLDDLAFLAGKAKSQETLSFILTQLIQKGVQIVLTCNQAPALLPNFQTGLLALFHQGLIVDLPGADYASREKIIRQYLQRNELYLDEKIVHFLSDNLNGNLHHLHSVMIRLTAQMSLMDHGLQLDDVRYIVSNICPQADISSNFRISRRALRVDEIVKATSDFFQIPIDVVQGNSRKKKIVRARQTAIYLCRELTSESLNTIGYHFSNLHHASVLYAYNKVVKDLEIDPALKPAIEKIKTLLFQ